MKFKKIISLIMITALTIVMTASISLSAETNNGDQLTVYIPSKEKIDKSGIDVIVIDKKTAFSTGGEISIINTNPPQYLKFSDFMTEESDNVSLPSGVDKKMVFTLLTLGSPLDLSDLTAKHSLSEGQSYLMTQEALWVLLGNKNFNDVYNSLKDESSKAYLKELMTVSYAKETYSDKIKFSSSNISFTETDGKYISQEITADNALGGVFKFTNLPEGVKIYSTTGAELTNIPVGTSFVIKTDNLASKTLSMNIEYIHKIPTILEYGWISGTGDSTGKYDNMITADFADEEVSQVSQTYDFNINPNTADAQPDFYLIAAAAILIAAITIGAVNLGKEQKR